jgi:hypothetical protein
MRTTPVVIIAATLASATACHRGPPVEVAEPNEQLGTVVYFVPKQHAEGNPFRDPGFVAVVLQQTDEKDIKPTFVAHSASEFVTRYRRLSLELQQCGIWLRLQENDPYSPEEKRMLEELKTLCSKHKLPLFIHTGQEVVTDDWQRFSCRSPERSNQTMKLTATATRSGDAFLIATFLSLRIGLSPGGRSLSFSR